MKHLLSLCAVALVAFGLTVSSHANVTVHPDNPALEAAEKAAIDANWSQLSENLAVALTSDNDGVKQGAMRLVIQYGAHIDVQSAVFDVVRIYRNHDDDHMRRMAVVTLGHMNNDWAILFLERSLQFERSEPVKNTIQAVINDYRTLG